MTSRFSPVALVVALSVALGAGAARAQQPAQEDVVKLASPGFQGTGVDPSTLSFLTDHYAQQLVVHGVRVVTASEITALVGFERQKELLGCNENNASCLTELGNALGVDGLVVGSVGKFGTTYQLNIKVLSATTGQPIAVASSRASGDTGALDELTRMARAQAQLLQQKLGKKAAAQSAVAVSTSDATRDPNLRAPSFPVGRTILGSGMVLLGGLFIVTGATADWSDVEDPGATQATAYALGGALALGGGALIYFPIRNYNRDMKAYEEATKVTFRVGPGGGQIGLVGTW